MAALDINPFTQKGEWTEDYDQVSSMIILFHPITRKLSSPPRQSRPHICHITSYNLRIVSVFHFGFQELTDWLLNYYRYCAPIVFGHESFPRFSR